MIVVPTALPGVLRVEPAVHRDSRGSFREVYSASRYAAAGIPETFVQDNVSLSGRAVLRGLHFQHPFDQAKLIHVLAGEVFDVAVDVRVGSPTFGKWVGEFLSEDNCHQLYIPGGFAHGFVVISTHVILSYKCSEYYRPEFERSVRWDDPRLGIEWPVRDVSVSPRDGLAPLVDSLPEGTLPTYDSASRVTGSRD